ncbi:MAG TPA: hypothetical protein VL043_05145 [Protaetiibacter sp.]|nr:hypothetical protein [Protaetiibacter sp.]
MTTITQALDDAKRRLQANSEEMKELESRLTNLRALQRSLANEVSVLESVATRGLETDTETPSSGDDDATGAIEEDWSDKERLWSIIQAVFAETNRVGHATPASVAEYLAARGRTEDKDNVGAALSYLRKQGTVARVARGQWVPAPAIEAPEEGELF